MRRIVSNTGPVLHLSEAGALALLSLTGEVHIPRAVDAEMVQNNPEWAKQRPEWVMVDELTVSHNEDARLWQQAGLLDTGEAEAVALARQINAQWLVTDDSTARVFAQAVGLEVHGSLGIILWVVAAGHINPLDAEATLDRLARSSLWVSRRVLAEAKAALRELSS